VQVHLREEDLRSTKAVKGRGVNGRGSYNLAPSIDDGLRSLNRGELAEGSWSTDTTSSLYELLQPSFNVNVPLVLT
jgi:hypothetical protein